LHNNSAHFFIIVPEAEDPIFYKAYIRSNKPRLHRQIIGF